MVGVPEDGHIQLEIKQAALEESLTRLDKGLPKNEFVRIENGELTLSPLDKEEEEIRKEHPLAKRIGPLLPPIQLGQLLAEVDSWTGFSDQLTHACGTTSRIPDLAALYATLLTQGCNMTLSGMADMMFALFDLLGMQFSPRLRDIGDYTLYRVDMSTRYKQLNPRAVKKARARSK